MKFSRKSKELETSLIKYPRLTYTCKFFFRVFVDYVSFGGLRSTAANLGEARAWHETYFDLLKENQTAENLQKRNMKPCSRGTSNVTWV